MRLSDALEVAIGLTFIFLIASLVLTSLREALELGMKLRGKAMFTGIIEMLHDRDFANQPGGADNGKKLALTLYRHPHISGLMKGTVDDPNFMRKLPSYLPSRSVALALMDQAMSGKFALSVTANTEFPIASALPAEQQLRLLAQSIENTPLRTMLVHAIDTGAQDFDSVRANLEEWFDGAMDRVSGYYKRWSQFILFGMGLLMAVTLNVNTLTIANALFNSPTMRTALVGSTAAKDALDSCRSSASATDNNTVTCENSKLIALISAAEIPVGWSDTSIAALYQPVSGATDRFGKLFGFAEIAGGWLFTALAVSLGSPFWFSVLNRLMMMRNSLKPGDTTEGITDPPPDAGTPVPQTSTGMPPPASKSPPSCCAIDHAVYTVPRPEDAKRQFEGDDGEPVTGITAMEAAQ